MDEARQADVELWMRKACDDLAGLVAFVDDIAAAVKKHVGRLIAQEDDLPSGPR
jgi:hypothetical protein